jgi:hypothetical protein
MGISTKAAAIGDDDEEDKPKDDPDDEGGADANKAKKSKDKMKEDAKKTAAAREKLPDFNITVYVLAVTYRQVGSCDALLARALFILRLTLLS